MRNHQKTFTMLLVLVLIGLNMRPLLTSVGPLLPQLRQASGMSFSVAALLTALPVVTMGGLALAGSWLHQHVSERRSVAISLLLIAVGALMREFYPQSALLLSSALLGGVGIGIILVSNTRLVGAACRCCALCLVVAKRPRGRLFPQDNNHSGSRGIHSPRVDAGCLLRSD